MSVLTLPRTATLADLAWLNDPGTYVVHVTGPTVRSSRALLAREGKARGRTVRTSLDAGRLTVEVRP